MDRKQVFFRNNKFFEHLEEKKYKIQYRVLLSRYRGKTICPECKGSRLKKEAGYVKVSGNSIQAACFGSCRQASGDLFTDEI
jgi:excinuclease ABC subunit A